MLDHPLYWHQLHHEFDGRTSTTFCKPGSFITTTAEFFYGKKTFGHKLLNKTTNISNVFLLHVYFAVKIHISCVEWETHGWFQILEFVCPLNPENLNRGWVIVRRFRLAQGATELRRDKKTYLPCIQRMEVLQPWFYPSWRWKQFRRGE